MRQYITGGAKNGKSLYAQGEAVRLADGGPLYYVATMIPSDREDWSRIDRHLRERYGLGFVTLEWGHDLQQHMWEIDPDGTYLLDSVTALLLNELYPRGSDVADIKGAERCIVGLLGLGVRGKNVIYVSDLIGSDAVLYDEYTELFRMQLARIDREIAQTCDMVVEMCCGQKIVYRGNAK